jgi:hypothetical protein
LRALRDEQERWDCEKRALVGKYMRAFQPSDHVEGEVVNMADRGVDNSGRRECEKRALVGKYMRAFQPSDHVEGEVVNIAGRGVDNSGR